MSSIASLNSDAKSDQLHRNVADFKPSVWGNYFDQYASESMVSKHIFYFIFPEKLKCHFKSP
jgi:hypothetical protein